MFLFHKFFLKELSKYFFLLLVIFSTFFLIGDFFDKLSSFVNLKKPLIFFLEYLFWKMQVNFYQIFPYLLGLASLLTLFFLSRTYELLAFLSLGFQKWEILKVILYWSLIFSLLGGLILNFIVPKAFFQTQYTWEVKIEGKLAQHLIFKGTLFFEEEEYILMAKPLEPKAEYLEDLIFLKMEENIPQRIIWAKKAFYLGKGKWRLEDAIFQEKTTDFSPSFYKNWVGDLPLKPNRFITIEKSVKFASLKELYQRFLFLRKINKPYTEVVAEVANRIFYLFYGMILALFPTGVYLKNYTPHNYRKNFFKALFFYFLITFIVMFLQLLLQKFIWLLIVANIIILIALISFLIYFSKERELSLFKLKW